MKRKKLGPLRRAFNYAGAVILAVHFGTPAIIGHVNDRTDSESVRLGIDPAQLRKLTPGPFHIFYPEDKASYIVPFLQGLFSESRQIHGEHDYARNTRSRYEFFGVSIRSRFYGYKGIADGLTFGLTRHMFPCIIVAPSDRLSAEIVKRSLSGLTQPAHFPGDIRDYQQLFLAHEVAHCDQSPWKKREFMERNADMVSMEFFLNRGGDPEIVRAVIYGRSITALTAFLYANPDESDEGPLNYIMGPALHQRFINAAAPAFSAHDIRAGYFEAVAALTKIAGGDASLLYDDFRRDNFVRAALLRPDIVLSPAARRVLELHREAFDFFMIPVPEKKPRPAMGAHIS